jgi:phosphate transport system substrate-binding protein
MMQKRRLKKIGLMLVSAMIFCFAASRLFAETVKIGGSGAAIGVMRLIGLAFAKQHLEIKVDLVPGLGSGGGRKALMGGALDLAVTARPGDGVEKVEGAVARPCGKSPLVLAANQAVVEKNLTTRDIVDIYAGKKISWSNGERIRVILRPLTDSDSDVLQGVAPEMATALKIAHTREGMKIAITDEESASAIESTPGGLGSSMLCLIVAEKPRLNPLSINGMVPSVKAIADGSYPFFKTFYLVSKPDLSPSARRFVDFVLSRQGAQLLFSMGHRVPDMGTP